VSEDQREWMREFAAQQVEVGPAHASSADPDHDVEEPLGARHWHVLEGERSARDP